MKIKGGRRRPLVSTTLRLDRLDALCLQALRPLRDGELYRLAFLQAAETAGLDGREMHEYVFAGLPRDEAESLGVVKPLHCSCFHVTNNPYLNLR